MSHRSPLPRRSPATPEPRVRRSAFTALALATLALACKEKSPPAPHTEASAQPRPEGPAPAPAPPPEASLHAPGPALGEAPAVSVELDPAGPPGDLAAEIESFVDLPGCVQRHKPTDPLLAEGLEALGYERFTWDTCRNIEALKLRRPEPCEAMLSSALRRRCLVNLATFTAEPSLCPLDEPAPGLPRHDIACLAAARRDLRTCSGLRNPARAVCEGLLVHDPTRCGTDDRCVRQIARWQNVLPVAPNVIPYRSRITVRLEGPAPPLIEVPASSNLGGPAGPNLGSPASSNLVGPASSNPGGPASSNLGGPAGPNLAVPASSNLGRAAGPQTKREESLELADEAAQGAWLVRRPGGRVRLAIGETNSARVLALSPPAGGLWLELPEGLLTSGGEAELGGSDATVFLLSARGLLLERAAGQGARVRLEPLSAEPYKPVRLTLDVIIGPGQSPRRAIFTIDTWLRDIVDKSPPPRP